MRKLKLIALYTAGSLASTLAAVSGARAIEDCAVRVDRRDGTIAVRARGITGTPRWGGESGAESLPFFNTATCVVGDSGGAIARDCLLGDPATVAARTPPESCSVYLADDGPESCAAWIRDCSPGIRATNPDLLIELEALTAVLSRVRVESGRVIVENANLEIRSGNGPTGAANGRGNLIVGYNLADPGDLRLGSHNLIIGDGHSHSAGAIGGLLVGENHSITSISAAIGGHSNQTAAAYSVVAGGAENVAGGTHALVIGGSLNTAQALSASVVGGTENLAIEIPGAPLDGESTILGGWQNVTRAAAATVCGGGLNRVDHARATIGGSHDTISPGIAQSVCGN